MESAAANLKYSVAAAETGHVRKGGLQTTGWRFDSTNRMFGNSTSEFQWFSLNGASKQLAPLFTLKGDFKMTYRYEAQSVVAFVQQLASNILARGYYFFVTGVIPAGKDPRIIDAKLLAKYRIDVSRQTRARRKLAGQANLHYLRYQRFFILIATHGTHPFFTEEATRIKDARRQSIRFGGYSLAVKQGGFLRKTDEDELPRPDTKFRVRVQIAREEYANMKAFYIDIARRRSTDDLSRELYCVPYEPYAPIRKQLLNILRLVNQERSGVGMEKIPSTVLRYRREIQKVYVQEVEEGVATPFNEAA